MSRELAVLWVALALTLPNLAPRFAGATNAVDSRLVDQDGHAVAARELNGRWLLVYFGYASCKEICPAALTTLTAVLERMGPAGNAIDPIFVSLDAEHDSPAVLKRFAASFHPRLRALSGSADAVADAARTFEVPWQRTSASVLDHGTLFYLVAPDGRVVQVLHPEQPVADLAAAISKRMAARASS